ncbi:MAG: hypothetical protein IPI30_21610 [Saprospiraceae bacterium]|nr:hypothetical protein [Candidatus Vicinibacter affinis]
MWKIRWRSSGSFFYGYTKGTVDFGDGSPPVDLRSQGALVHQYSDTGVFLIKMRVVNGIGCEDEFERMVCVKNVVRIFIRSISVPTTMASMMSI